MQLHSELLIAQQRLQSRFKQLESWQRNHHNWLFSQQSQPATELKQLLSSLKSEQQQLNQVLQPLTERILQTGMAPFALACDLLQRASHDIASATGKNIQLQITGQQTEFDRLIVEALKDPLLQLLRNAIDHGIESPQQRQASNKPEQGKVVISANLQQDGVCISIADDGKGIDLAALRARVPEHALVQNDDELLNTILLPGLSTAREVTAVSGRGFGLDIVSQAVQRLRGQLKLHNKPGQGLEVKLHLPVNLSVLYALKIGCAGQVFYLDAQAVAAMQRVTKQQLLKLDNNWVLPQATASLPVVSLAALLNLPVTPWSEQTKLPLIQLTDGRHSLGILVDELLNEQQIAVKPLGPRFTQSKCFSGASLLPDGKVALIIDSSRVIQAWQAQTEGFAWWQDNDTEQHPSKKRLLIAEDSVTTRTLLKGMLELAGFDITLAEDGMQAWQQLQRDHFDLLVSDVEMPFMSGFELTEQVRKSVRCKHLPIILVTALKTDEDKLKGMQAGANAYIVKSHFEQTELLNTINQLL